MEYCRYELTLFHLDRFVLAQLNKMRGGYYVSSERLYEEWGLGRIDTRTIVQVLLGAPMSIVRDAATLSWLTR